MDVTIYKLSEGGVPLYVGLTGNPLARYRWHIHDAFVKEGERHRRFRELIELGRPPLMEVLATVPMLYAFSAEYYWMREIWGRVNGATCLVPLSHVLWLRERYNPAHIESLGWPDPRRYTDEPEARPIVPDFDPTLDNLTHAEDMARD